MSYRCSICDAVTPNGQARHTHCVHRTVSDGVTRKSRQEIAAEYPVCRECKVSLDRGVTLRSLLIEVVRADERPLGESSLPADTSSSRPAFGPSPLRGAYLAWRVMQDVKEKPCI